MSSAIPLRDIFGSLSPPPITENSSFFKAISYVPFVGIIFSLIQQNSLAEKMKHTSDAPRLIELIKVKNEYKLADMGRCLLHVALTVAGIFSGTFGIRLFFTGVWCYLAARYYSHIEENRKIITELETNGFRPGMTAF